MNKKLWCKTNPSDSCPEDSFNGMKDLIGNGRDVATERPDGQQTKINKGPERRESMNKKLWRKANPSDSCPEESFNGMKDLIGNGRDFAFAYRLACEEGPWHHAYANSILLNALLKGSREIADQLGIPIVPYDGEVVEVPMHRPPHNHHLSGNGVYPVDLPVGLILTLADGDEKRAEEMIEALTEGAPHHVMANILIMHMAEALMTLAMKRKAVDKAGG